MTTIRESIEARIKELEADAAAERAKLENLHPTLAAVLEHPVEQVVAFIRTFGDHIFKHKAVQAAIAVATHAQMEADADAAVKPAAPAESTGQAAA